MNLDELGTAQNVFPSWQIRSWPSVRVAVDDWRTSTHQFRRLSTKVERDSGGRLQGQAFWAAEAGGWMVGLAWDWKEAMGGVPTMLDPMSVLSNVELVDAEGRTLSDGERLLHVNGSIYCLPWQEDVLEMV